MNTEKFGQIQLPAPEDISNLGFTHICPIGLFVRE